nr:lysozyme C-like [Procambarus clarkii]
MVWWVVVAVVAATMGSSSGKVFTKCELAALLENTYHLSRDVVKNLVCIAEFESSFNTQAINRNNWDGSTDYGLLQINDRYWCSDPYNGQNLCKLPCTSLLDNNVSDDLKCAQIIIQERESWNGKGTGYSAWVAYTTNCQYLNLDQYMSQCWGSG